MTLADIPSWAAPYARGEKKWPFAQISDDDAPYYWAQVAPPSLARCVPAIQVNCANAQVFRRSANLFANASYEAIVQSLPGGGVSPKYVLDLTEPYTGP